MRALLFPTILSLVAFQTGCPTPAPTPDVVGADNVSVDAQGSDVQGGDVQGGDVQGTDAQGVDAQGNDVQGTDVQATDATAMDTQNTDVQGTDTVALDVTVPDVQVVDVQTADSGSAFMAFPVCLTAGDYVAGSTTSNTVTTPGFVYSPKCMTVSAGTTVTFNSSFGSHPLTPANGGSPSNPITSTSTGTTVSFAFPTPGFYPYYCAFHGTSSAAGMAGVIQVVP